jgi:hypothetical protein
MLQLASVIFCFILGGTELMVIGLIKMSPLSMPIVGFTSKTTVMLDFDDLGYSEVKYWAFTIMKKFRLEGFIVLQSSMRHYHIIFNKKLTYEKCVSIIADVCLYAKSESLSKWFHLQCIKGEFTLRVSSKGEKPSPKIVFRYGKNNKEIKEFLQYRQMEKNIIRNIARLKKLHA